MKLQHLAKSIALKPIALATLLVLGTINAHAEDAAPAPEAEKEYTFLDSIMEGKPMTSFRLRYEHVNQDGLQPATIVGTVPNPTATQDLKDGEGVTLRSLIGWQTSPFHNLSFAAQLIDVSKLQDDFNDSTNSTLINGASNQPNKVAYAKIVDPDYTGVNQLYVDWTGIKNNRVRVGRQAINLDNVRFVGDIGFRQVMQVFDGISLVNKMIPDTEIFAGHMERVRQITTVLRTNGHLDMLNAKYRYSPTESITGYAYLSNFKDLGLGNAWFGGTTNGGANQSNQVYGVRVDGIHPFNPNLRALYTAEYAKQTDFDSGDSRIDAHYYKLGGGVGIDNFSIRADQELLSSNGGKFAFQTPFGTNHLFQGWVDKFLATPKEGIRDSFVTATYRYEDFSFFADYHLIDSDSDFYTVGSGAVKNGSRYGKEWNVAATWNIDKNWMTKVEYGKYSEDDHYAAAANTTANAAGTRGRIRDTDKLWLTAMYTF